MEVIGHDHVGQDAHTAESRLGAHEGDKFLCRDRASVAKGEDETAINDSGDAVVKAAETRLDSRKTHNEETLYTTNIKCVAKFMVSARYLIRAMTYPHILSFDPDSRYRGQVKYRGQLY